MKPPYLILLRMGFAVPSALLKTRWALTPPFHPYPERRRALAAKLLAVYSLWHFPSPFDGATGRYPASCPLEFGLSSAAGETPADAITDLLPRVIIGGKGAKIQQERMLRISGQKWYHLPVKWLSMPSFESRSACLLFSRGTWVKPLHLMNLRYSLAFWKRGIMEGCLTL